MAAGRWRRAALFVGAAVVGFLLAAVAVAHTQSSTVEAELRRMERQVERLTRIAATAHPVENVFVDCGAAGGDSIRAFLDGTTAQGGDFGGVAAQGHWLVIAFEPNAKFSAELLALPVQYPNHRFVIFNGTAASTRTELVPFHLTPSKRCGDCGSSLLPNVWRKVDHDATSRTVIVPALNLAELLLETVSVTDTVVVKMDIEAYEGALLSHLLVEGVIPLLDVLYVEWHRWSPTAWMHPTLKKILAEAVELKEWK